MLRELAVFLCCCAAFARASYSHYEPIQTSVSFSSPAPPLDISTAQPIYNIPIESKLLQTQQPKGRESPIFSIQKHVAQYPGISSNAYVYVASQDPTISINPAVVKSVTVPVATSKQVTVEAHKQITAHPPTATYQPAPVPVYPVQHQIKSVNPAVQYVAPSIGYSQAFSQETVTAHPPSAAYVTSTVAPKPLQQIQAVQYVSAPITHQAVNTLSAPIAEKKITVEAHQSVTAHPPSATRVISAPLVKYPIQTPIQAVVKQPTIYHVPTSVAESSVRIDSSTVQSQETVTAYPPSAAYVISKLQSPSLNNVQTVINRPAVQYVPTPVKPVLVKAVAPLPSKTVTIESHQSVTAHPPPPPSPPTPAVIPIRYIQTVSKPPSIQYVTAAVKPIPVPVYNTVDSPTSEYIAVTKYSQPASTIVSNQGVAIPQSIPVPVAYPKSEAYVGYNINKVSTPVVYTKSIVEKDHTSADLVATHVNPGFTEYATAVKFSPASAVSSVSFNGNGVSYGW